MVFGPIGVTQQYSDLDCYNEMCAPMTGVKLLWRFGHKAAAKRRQRARIGAKIHLKN